MTAVSDVSRYRVLVLAEQANPEWVSVPLVGWNQVAALSQLADVHLVTHDQNESAIRRSTALRGRVTFIKSNWIDKVFNTLAYKVFKFDFGSQALTAFRVPFYWYFEWRVWRQFKASLKAGNFDFVHRLTPVAPVIGSPMATWCARIRIPFILGPINGGIPWPGGYPTLARERSFLGSLRELYKLFPYARSMVKNASSIIVASRNNWDQLPEQARGKATLIPENAVGTHEIVSTPPSKENPLRAVFVGRLVPMKGCDLAIRAALPLIREGLLTFDIIGDGYDRAELERLMKEAGVIKGVHFHGWISRAEVMQRLGSAQIFLFPSLREFGGGVVMEAMAKGLVPIVMDYGGPGETVDETCGIKLPMTNAETTVAELTQTLRSLIQDPARLDRLAAGALKRMHGHFTWEQKAAQFVAIYQRLKPRRTLS